MLDVTQITKVALRILDMRDCEVWRQNNARTRAGFTFKGKKGVPDIIGYHRKTGVFVACEVKTARDRLSLDQYDLLCGIKRAGGIAVLAIEDSKGNVILVDPVEAVKDRPGLLKY